MYATTIGRTFLKAYNCKFKTEYTAKSFFEDVFVPLFFDHHKYMMTAGNSPLENPKLSWDDMIKGKKPFETPERRQERINKMIHKKQRRLMQVLLSAMELLMLQLPLPDKFQASLFLITKKIFIFRGLVPDLELGL